MPFSPERFDSADAQVGDEVQLHDAMVAIHIASPVQVPYQQQITPLGRSVRLIQSASLIAVQTTEAHKDHLHQVVTRYHQLIEQYARVVEEHLQEPWQQTIDTITKQKLHRVSAIRTSIEVKTGPFTQKDNDFLLQLPYFEIQFLFIPMLGLFRQEMYVTYRSNIDGTPLEDLSGSCLLEAREWQLVIFNDWIVELESGIAALTGGAGV